MDKIIENVKVESVYFGLDTRFYNHLVVVLTLRGKGWGVSYMSPALTTKNENNEYSNWDEGLNKIHELLDFFEVNNINDIKGKYCKVEVIGQRIGDVLYHIIEDKSFTWKVEKFDEKEKDTEKEEELED